MDPAPGTEVPGGLASRRFVLAVAPPDGAPRLTPEDVRHAVRVLRIGPGERLEGLDGRGNAWTLEVTGAGRRELELVTVGEPRSEPAPGTEGAALPHIEIALSLPKGSRAEDCLGRLTQLGVSRLTPLVTHRTPPHAREAGAARRERLLRAGREAAKQCGRLWFPEVGEVETLDGWLARRAALPRAWFDPRGERSVLDWPAPVDASRLALAIGPEGGFTTDEEAELDGSGAARLRLGAHVLRIETAAEAALAVVAARALTGR